MVIITGRNYKLLQQAEVFAFIKGLVASKLFEGYDNHGDVLAD
ncbi:MAG: hypothetical protein ACJA1H_002055 [Glaciecola sp.]|jgi:hypothetical protein